MRYLVACPECQRQYDAAELPVGSRFHCACGHSVEVPRLKAVDAAVVRCSACGARRENDADTCNFCGSAFTLHDRDLQTMCASCMARLSDRARFCHRCGTRVASEGRAGTAAEQRCPACGEQQQLSHRSLGQPEVALLECPRCAGLWLSRGSFEALLERTRASEAPDDPFQSPDRTAPARAGSRATARRGQTSALYRRCPECSRHMHRRNYGRRSGVIVDTCKEHGIWLDAQELDQLLEWIRRGGASRAALREEEERREQQVRERFRTAWKLPDNQVDLVDSSSDTEWIGAVFGALFGR